MLYADTDFFLGLLKPSDWLKNRAESIYSERKEKIRTAEVTFIELLLLAKRFGLPAITTTAAAMKISNYKDTTPLMAAKYIEEGVGVFDAFHAAHCKKKEKIISSDHIYDSLGLERVKLEECNEES
ncbi:MAG: PIN domain-containing protein [Promethearchaeia archaeon]